MTMYLIDNNALGPLGDRKKSAFFAEHCRVSADVAHESRRAKHAELLSSLTIEPTPAMLGQLTSVMNSIPVGDTALVDLYNNKGTADPLLVAMAVVLSTEHLFSEDWVIVTNDKAVAAKAGEFEVESMTPQDLARLIDETMESA